MTKTKALEEIKEFFVINCLKLISCYRTSDHFLACEQAPVGDRPHAERGETEELGGLRSRHLLSSPFPLVESLFTGYHFFEHQHLSFSTCHNYRVTAVLTLSA